MLHNRGEVADTTRNKVLKIIDELNYHPNILASTLASKKSVVFVTLFPQPPSEEAYWNKPLTGVRQRIAELQQYGVQSYNLTFSQFDARDFDAQAAKVLELQPDGVVLAPFYYRESLKFVSVLNEKGIPFIFIDSEIRNAGQIAYVGQDSYQSGHVAGKILGYITSLNQGVLVIHFAKEMDNQNHLVQREKGFYDWFREHQPGKIIRTIEVSNTDNNDWESCVSKELSEFDAGGIFVTNSKVFLAAQLLEKLNLKHIRLVGHDLLEENKKYLNDDVVNFLICQRPEEQGYNAINKLFQYVIRKKPVESQNYSSIEIVTKENMLFYKEFK